MPLWSRRRAQPPAISNASRNGVDVDAELMGGDGTVPPLFFFRDLDGNQLMIVEAQ
jgi:hypothetical protein